MSRQPPDTQARQSRQNCCSRVFQCGRSCADATQPGQYDLQTDPHEVNNLADQPDHQDVLAGLQRKLRTWQQKTKDPWILKYKYE